MKTLVQNLCLFAVLTLITPALFAQDSSLLDLLSDDRPVSYASKSPYNDRIDKIPTVTREYTKDSLEDIEDQGFTSAKSAKNELVDAVTGATRHKKAIYKNYARMAASLIDELKANPDWERTPLP